MLMLSVLLACGGSPTTLTPESAAALADAIETSPSGADAALEEAGVDAEAFEAYLFTVAEDAELTRRYLAARR